MQIISLDLQLDEKEDEESASILAKWDLCLNPIKKKVLTTAPGKEWIKMLTDGSISEHGKACGGLARDDKGDICALSSS